MFTKNPDGTLSWTPTSSGGDGDRVLALSYKPVEGLPETGATYEERKRLCEAEVTLDGLPAVISGACCEWAMVSQVPDGLSYEWAWDTVAEVVCKGGHFKS